MNNATLAKAHIRRPSPVRWVMAVVAVLAVAAAVLVGLVPAGVARAAPPTQGLPANWVALGSGQFETADPVDLLEYRVELNAVDPAVVEFRLESFRRCHWGKTLVMPDGLGSQWDINIGPSRGTFAASNGLWAQQVKNGQSLQLWKAGWWGFKYKVLDIGNLGAIPPGSRVVFTWLRDSGNC